MNVLEIINSELAKHGIPSQSYERTATKLLRDHLKKHDLKRLKTVMDLVSVMRKKERKNKPKAKKQRRQKKPEKRTLTPEENRQRKIGNFLCKLLRHVMKTGTDGSVKESVFLKNILLQNILGKNITLTEYFQIISKDSKNRYSRVIIDREWHIRANQGHSTHRVKNKDLLTEITDPNELSVLVHGTRSEFLPSIRENGLDKRRRKNLHLISDITAKSGFREDCDTLIYIDAEKAMEGGCSFYRSSNGVVLTQSTIPEKWFSKVVKRTSQ
jgi:putative RNA 2'-phosphotransferase